MCSDGSSSQVVHEPLLVSQEDSFIKIGSKQFNIHNRTDHPSPGPRKDWRSSVQVRLHHTLLFHKY